MQVITIGLDIAKNVFQLHGVTGEGTCERVVLCKRMGRAGLERFFAGLSPSVVGMEACGSSHHWARVLSGLGHEVRIMPASYVKPFVKRNKTDARDAAAICLATRQATTMRFVAIKSVEQQCERAVHRARDLLVRQRTQQMNAIRAMLAEMGIVAAQGLKGFATLRALVEGVDPAIPALLLPSLSALVRQWHALDAEATELEREIVARARADARSRRLMTIPGVGPLTAHAIVAAIGDGGQFAAARDFAAWVGLTPKQASSGDKHRSMGITRAGDRGLRRLLTLGAAARLRQLRARPDKAGPWITGILARRPMKVAVVAQAAKTARIAFAVLTSGQNYRDRPAAA
jgi:transposase